MELIKIVREAVTRRLKRLETMEAGCIASHDKLTLAYVAVRLDEVRAFATYLDQLIDPSHFERAQAAQEER